MEFLPLNPVWLEVIAFVDPLLAQRAQRIWLTRDHFSGRRLNDSIDYVALTIVIDD
jgi:hypothetical protein